MSGLVLDLQAKIISGNISASNAAREALAISSKLGQKQIEAWLHSEVFGYGNDETPEYRSVIVEPQFFNPYNGWCPIVIGEGELREYLTAGNIGQPLGEIENLLASDASCVQRSYPPELEAIIQSQLPRPMRIRGKISKSFLYRVCEHVRNTILKWLLELEKNGVTGNGMSFSADERRSALAPSQTIYATNVGVIASSHDSSTQNISATSQIDARKIEGLVENVEPALALLDKNSAIAIRGHLEAAKVAAETGDHSKSRGSLDAAKRIAENIAGNVGAAGIVSLIASLLS
jgi:hypothetical protein